METVGFYIATNSTIEILPMYFDPSLKRTISVDIRYVLFIIEKYAGADNLIKEMKLVSRTGKATANPGAPKAGANIPASGGRVLPKGQQR